MPEKTPAQLVQDLATLQAQLARQDSSAPWSVAERRAALALLEDQQRALTQLQDEAEKLRAAQRRLTTFQQRLEHDQRRLRDFLELARAHGSDVLLRLERSGKMHAVAAQAQVWWGLASTLLEERPLTDFLPREHHERLLGFLGEVLNRDGVLAVNLSVRGVGLDVFAATLHACRQIHPHTGEYEILGLLRRAAPPTSPQEELAGLLAHELNQPLTALLAATAACARLMDQERGPQDDLTQAARDALREAERAADIVQALRRLVRGDKVGQAAESLPHLVRLTLDSLAEEQRRAGAEIQVDLAEPLPLVAMDAVQARIVLTNLLRNALEAVQAVPAGQRVVRLGARPVERQVEVTVADSGPGIAPDQARNIFAPRASGKERGLGLGLHLCLHIVQAHGGALYHAPQPGPGAVFRFTLPMAAQAAC